MSYNQGSYKRPAWIGIVVAVGLGLWFFGPGLSRVGERARLSTPAGFEAEMLRNPDAGELFKAMKVTNPEELNGFFEDGAQKMRNDATEAQMAAFSRAFMLSIVQRQPQQLAVAPHGDLVTLFQTQTRLVDKVHASDLAKCASLSARGAIEGAGPELRPAINATAIARLRGAAAGRDHPQADVAKVTAADVRALAAAMRKNGLSEGDTNLFLTSNDMTGVSPQSQCEIMYYTYHAVLEMPEAQGDRVMRWLVGPA